MQTILEVFSMYGNLAVLILLLILMIMVGVGIRRVKQLKRHVEMIQNKVAAYLAVVMEEEELLPEEAPGHVISLQERQMKETVERKQKRQQEEIFNAVLQEIFP